MTEYINYNKIYQWHNKHVEHIRIFIQKQKQIGNHLPNI